jgi:hypothetical protein
MNRDPGGDGSASHHIDPNSERPQFHNYAFTDNVLLVFSSDMASLPFLAPLTVKPGSFLSTEEDEARFHRELPCLLLLKGDGVEQDTSLAAEHYNMAADQGHAGAQTNSAILLQNGDEVERDKALAAHYYKLSADHGNATAQFNYAFLAEKGDGIQQDKSIAAQYFKRSADQGNAAARRQYEIFLGGELNPD